MADDSVFSPDDLPILVAMCIRYEKRLLERKKATEAKKAAEALEAAAIAELLKVAKAMDALGTDSTQEAWFRPIRDAYGRKAFDDAMKNAGLYLYFKDHDEGSNNQEVAARPLVAIEEVEFLPASSPIRDLVLERLRLAGHLGTKAAPIRSYIEQLRGTELHEKTIGMTLYRLSRDGLARREGRTWFFVPETKNPAGETAGSINRDTKEGEEL